MIYIYNIRSVASVKTTIQLLFNLLQLSSKFNDSLFRVEQDFMNIGGGLEADDVSVVDGNTAVILTNHKGPIDSIVH